MAEKLLVSACLLGMKCRYDGKSVPCKLNLPEDKFIIVPFCPEIYGGLPTPRTPSEIVGDKVMTSDGRDVSENYERGAREALLLAEKLGIKKALLKERSPSCGNNFIYDGTFSGKLKKGNGVTAKLLKENKIEVLGESDLERLINEVGR
jgi:uncharacterized protein YbbK (DUF523 family)